VCIIENPKSFPHDIVLSAAETPAPSWKEGGRRGEETRTGGVSEVQLWLMTKVVLTSSPSV